MKSMKQLGATDWLGGLTMTDIKTNETIPFRARLLEYGDFQILEMWSEDDEKFHHFSPYRGTERVGICSFSELDDAIEAAGAQKQSLECPVEG